MYISTRGGGVPQSFTDVMLAGLAPDGGLYVPQVWPHFTPAQLAALAGRSYADIAFTIIKPFVGGTIPDDDLESLITQTYKDVNFDHAAIAPLAQLGPNAWIMELFHGPTFSFKDYALQLLGRMFDYVLAQRGERLTIVGATSGDTGSAAIEACRHCKNIDIFILYPHGRTSDVQRRQMTSVDAPNVFTIAVEGNFDDCQALVKSLFADEALRHDINLSAVNSINWVRIMAQIVYYVAAATALGATPARPVSFAVPTGNFGNVFAASAARRIGLPVHKLAIGTNRNDIITRFFESGTMSVGAVAPSLSPSMDIQVSSNFERYLFELLGEDAKSVTALMTQFAQDKSFSVSPALHETAKNAFTAVRCSDEDTLAMMRECHARTGQIIDPHTAVGLTAATKSLADDPHIPVISLACAHPAKFPEAVEKATGIKPAMPDRLSLVMNKTEHFTVMQPDLQQMKSFIRAHRTP